MIPFRFASIRPLSLLLLLGFTAACRPEVEPDAVSAEVPLEEASPPLQQVGRFSILASDLDHLLAERFGGRRDERTRQAALEELVQRARLAEAALQAGLDEDPLVRAESMRLLANRLKETVLQPQLREVRRAVSEARLRELYEANAERFVAAEKRRLAVLWLNPGDNRERRRQYEDKLRQARAWFFTQSELVASPEEGFSVLAVDHSEHPASRFKNGEVGWFEAESAATDWNRAVTEIGFGLSTVGEVSPLETRPEGVFLVRLMALDASIQRSFESVRAELERDERRRRREAVEAAFYEAIEQQVPRSASD